MKLVGLSLSVAFLLIVASTTASGTAVGYEISEHGKMLGGEHLNPGHLNSTHPVADNHANPQPHQPYHQPEQPEPDHGMREFPADDLFAAKKKFLISWAQLCEKWIVRMMERVNNSHVDEQVREQVIERLRAALGDVRNAMERINSSNNIFELRRNAMEIRKDWFEARKQIGLAISQLIVEKLDGIVDRVENVRDRFEAAGMNVSTIDEKITEIKSMIDDLKSYIEAGDIVAARETLGEIRVALHDLFRDMRAMGRAYIQKNESFVIANVNGTFEFTGNGSVLLRGKFDYTSSRPPVFERNIDGIRRVLLRGDVHVEASGEMMAVVHGKGTVTLNGVGSYKVKGEGLREINGSATIELR